MHIPITKNPIRILSVFAHLCNFRPDYLIVSLNLQCINALQNWRVLLVNRAHRASKSKPIETFMDFASVRCSPILGQQLWKQPPLWGFLPTNESRCCWPLLTHPNLPSSSHQTAWKVAPADGLQLCKPLAWEELDGQSSVLFEESLDFHRSDSEPDPSPSMTCLSLSNAHPCKKKDSKRFGHDLLRLMVNLDLGKPWKTFSSFVRKAMGFYKSTYIVCPKSEHQLAMSNQIWTGLWTTLFANPSFSQGPHSPLSTAFNLQQDRYRFPAVKLRRKPTACFLPNSWTVKHFHHVSSHANHASATSASNLRQPGLTKFAV